jgi:hypothetical protein
VHAQHLGPVAVQVDEQLLGEGAEGRVHALQFRPLPGLGQEGIVCLGGGAVSPARFWM